MNIIFSPNNSLLKWLVEQLLFVKMWLITENTITMAAILELDTIVCPGPNFLGRLSDKSQRGQYLTLYQMCYLYLQGEHISVLPTPLHVPGSDRSTTVNTTYKNVNWTNRGFVSIWIIAQQVITDHLVTDQLGQWLQGQEVMRLLDL